MAGSISIALQGLNVAMQGFQTSSSNIANVNTPGYSRQQVELSSRAAPEQGVEILNVSRVADAFANQQLWSSTASFSSTDVYSFFAGQTDDLLANPNTNISAVTDQFFAALQAGVDDPASIPNRELILAQSEALALRFVEVDRQLRAQNQAVNTKLESTVNETNQMAGLVAQLNDKIRLSEARGEPANELRDHRDELILSISEKIGVSVQTGTGSSDINLSVGNGQPLVVGGKASQLSARQGDPDINDVDIFVSVSGKQISVSDQIRSGEVGGMLEYRNEVLIPSWNELGRLAVVFADSVNQQQAKGVDLDGNMAENWFRDPANIGDIRAYSSNAVKMSSTSDVVIRDSNLLKASDYVVKFGENGDFSVTREADGKLFTQDYFQPRTATLTSSYEDGTALQTTGELKLNLDGLDITIRSDSGVAFGKNDQVLVQPVRTGAELMSVELSSGRELAFASPVRAEAAEDNQGTVSIAGVSVNSRHQLIPVDMSPAAPDALVYFTGENSYSVFNAPIPPANFDLESATAFVFADGSSALGRSYSEGKDIQIDAVTVSATTLSDANASPVVDLTTNPVQLVFGKDSAGEATYSLYDIQDPANPVVLSLNNRYVEGEPIQLEGFEITTRGKPQPGDRIDFGFNTEAVSDNRNALQFSGLQQLKLVDGATYQDNFGRLVEQVGTKAQVANINLQANEAIMQSARSVRDGVSGVNLDEEAANLIKFQQQYQAASQVINTARSMFDTLLSSVG
tara:strand:+ start:3209 stop:5440 length:2232 start_codon:yes stop_codon:yes gene_type:complete